MTDTAVNSLKGVLQAGARFLDRKGIEHPRPICELLLSRLLSCSRMDLYVRFEEQLNESQMAAMRRGIKRVSLGEPVQYIVGQTGFHDLVFRTDPRALIPRPETETLVEQVLACTELWERERPCVVDVGTGSGCIILSLASARPQGAFLAIDVSDDALGLACENAEVLGLLDRVRFVQGELPDLVEPESQDAIVSNPPYIPSAVVDQLPVNVRDHEPRLALDGGADGLQVVAPIIADAAVVLKPGGHLFMEIGDDQGKAVTELLRGQGFETVGVQPDLTGRDRVVYGTVPR